MSRAPTAAAGLAACFAVAAWALMLAGALTVADLDMFHQMALFREALAIGRVPAGDVFAYTPTVDPVVHHEWGTGALLYAVAVGAGLGAGGVMLLKYALIAALLAACARCAALRGAPAPVAALLAPVAVFLTTVGFATLRAQLLSLVLLACLLLLLEADRRGRRWWIAAWLPLYVVWLNLHGGFVAGAGVLALYGLERFGRAWLESGSAHAALRETRHLFAVGAAMVPLTLVNPYGAEYVPYLLHAVALERPGITEWLPLWHPVHHPALFAVYAASLAPVLYALVARGPRRLPGVLLLLVTAWLGLGHARHASLYAVVWFCHVPAWLAGTRPAAAVERAWRRMPAAIAAGWLVLGAAALVQAVQLRFWIMRVPNRAPGFEQGFPVGAVDYLASQRFAGNLMTPFMAGSYVSWKLHPRVKVSLDSRFEAAYPAGALAESDTFYEAAPGWEDVLARHPTDAALVPARTPIDSAMRAVSAMGARGAWRRVYEDDAYALYVRPGRGAGLPVVSRRGEPIAGTFP